MSSEKGPLWVKSRPWHCRGSCLLTVPKRTLGAANLLPQRLQNLHQFGMDEFIAAQHVAGFERIVVAFDAADDAAGFTDDDLPCRHVPWLQVALPVAIEATAGDESHIERGGTEPAQARHPVLDFGHLGARQIVVATADMRQA